MKAARRLGIAAITFLSLAAIARLLLDPLATRKTRDVLGDLEGFEGELAGVHVTVFPPGYEITAIRVGKALDAREREPLFFAERISARLRGGPLLHRQLVGDLRVEAPRIAMGREPRAPLGAASRRTGAPELAPQLARLFPFHVARVEIVRGDAATVVPLGGSFADSDVRLWPAVLAALGGTSGPD